MFIFDLLRRYSNFQTYIEYINYLKCLSLQFIGHATLTHHRPCVHATKPNYQRRDRVGSDMGKDRLKFRWEADDETRRRHASPRTNATFISTSDASRYSSGRARSSSSESSSASLGNHDSYMCVLGDRNPLRELIISRLEAPLQSNIFRATYFRIMQVTRLNYFDIKCNTRKI